MFLILFTLLSALKPIRDTTIVVTGDTLYITSGRIWNTTGTIDITAFSDSLIDSLTYSNDTLRMWRNGQIAKVNIVSGGSSDSSWTSISTDIINSKDSNDIEFTDDVVFDSTIIINGNLIRNEIPFAIQLLATGSQLYSYLSSNLTDGTHNKQSAAFPPYFNISDGDSIHFDSCYYAYQWHWDGVPDNTDTLIWNRIVTTFRTRSDLLANTSTYIYTYIYDTIIGSDGDGTHNYTQTLNTGGVTDSISIVNFGFAEIIVDVNAATSVDCGIGTPILYGRQIRR